MLLTRKEREEITAKGIETAQSWRDDWNKFAFEALGARLDREQRIILDAIQVESMISVTSGTARGKDYLTSVAVICFMYLTPEWDKNGVMIKNTKVALTAPTGRQITNIMKPEFVRHFKAAKRRGVDLPGRIVAADIRTDNEEWFLTGFKADDTSTEAWTGFHAVNTMFAITEATGISELTYNAIEGNLQGNSKLLLVFNPNINIGYAARSQKGTRFAKFRLNSMDAPNVVLGYDKIPGQIGIVWLEDKIREWCMPIRADEVKEEEDDFEYKGQWYRPEDIFRIKILGKFPKVSEDSLIPLQWIELAQRRWVEYHSETGSGHYLDYLRLGTDVAGMGRDSSVFCYRYGHIVSKFYATNSAGKADHMGIAGMVASELNANYGSVALIDTIGEGAGVWSALLQEGYEGRAFSTKYSEAARDEFDNDLTDITGVYKFENKRAYLFWCVRDWLNPKHNSGAMLPPGEIFTTEAIEIKFYFKYNGKIMIEPKEEIKTRLGKSTDYFDSLANTFDTPQFTPFVDKSYLY